MLRPFTLNCRLLYSEDGLLHFSQLQCMRNLDQYSVYDSGTLPIHSSLKTSEQQNTLSRDMIYLAFFLACDQPTPHGQLLIRFIF